MNVASYPPIAAPTSAGPLVYDAPINGPVPYYFRARVVDCLGRESGFTLCERPVEPKQAPVLLVHGWLGSDESWHADWESRLSGRGIPRVERIRFACRKDRWATWAAELKGYIGTRLLGNGAWKDDEAVDIVAHSQGGLASRSLIEEDGTGRSWIRTLFMLGTPNHGARFAETVEHAGDSWISACGSIGDAPQDLKPTSKRLARLNYGDDSTNEDMCSGERLETGDRGRVEYFTLAGTQAPNQDCDRWEVWKLRCKRDREARRPRDTCPTDGVVPAHSVRLRSVPAANQWMDFEVLPVGLAHNDELANAGRGEGITSARSVMEFVAGRLLREGVDLNPGQAPSPAEEATRVGPADEDGVEAAGLAILHTTRGPLAVGGEQEVAVQVDSLSALLVFVEWQGVPGQLELETPSGTIHPVVAGQPIPGALIETDSTRSYLAIELARPDVGEWKARVAGPSGADSTRFVLDWIGEGGVATLDGSTSPPECAGGAAVRLRARLRGAFGAETMSFVARFETEGLAPIEVPLSPTSSGNGVVVAEGLGIAPLVDQAVRVVFEARFVNRFGQSCIRTHEVTVDVSHRADLALRPDGLQVAPQPARANQEGLISAVIVNSGPVAADSASIEFTDTTLGETLGRVTFSVAAFDSIPVMLPWSPAAWGEHRIEALVTKPGSPDPSPENNAQGVLVTVIQGGVADAPVDSVQGIRTLSFGRPIPNPSTGDVTLSYFLPSPGDLELRIYDVRGRLVRELAAGPAAAGAGSLRWDGRDSRGARSGSGVYFARMRSGGGVLNQRIIRLH